MVQFIIGVLIGAAFLVDNKACSPPQPITYTTPVMTDFSKEEIEFAKAMRRLSKQR